MKSIAAIATSCIIIISNIFSLMDITKLHRENIMDRDHQFNEKNLEAYKSSKV